jgi:hypothetical protein
VHEAFAIQARADVERSQQVDGVLLEQTRANPALQVLTRAVLDDDRLDACALQQQREREPGRPSADDANLCPQLVLLVQADSAGSI